MITGANGTLWLSSPWSSFGLRVRDGIVVATPVYAGRWARGHDIHTIYVHAKGYEVRWFPEQVRGRPVVKFE
jgi:hypothetical protein